MSNPFERFQLERMAQRTIDLRTLTESEFRSIVLQQISFCVEALKELRDAASASNGTDDRSVAGADGTGEGTAAHDAPAPEEDGEDESPAITRKPFTRQPQD